MSFKPDIILRCFHNWGRTKISLLWIALMLSLNFSIQVYIKLNANRSGYKIFIARSFESIARVQESLLLSLFSSKYLLTASHPYYVITFVTHSPHISPGRYMYFTRNRSAMNKIITLIIFIILIIISLKVNKTTVSIVSVGELIASW